MGLRTSVPVLAGLNFKILWVELLLLPAVTVGALVLLMTTRLVGSYEVLSLPVGTQFLCIRKDLRLSPVILPIVGVDTDISFMVIFSVGAPDSFEVEHVEVHVRFEFFNKFNGEFVFGVSERAEL